MRPRRIYFSSYSEVQKRTVLCAGGTWERSRTGQYYAHWTPPTRQSPLMPSNTNTPKMPLEKNSITWYSSSSSSISLRRSISARPYASFNISTSEGAGHITTPMYRYTNTVSNTIKKCTGHKCTHQVGSALDEANLRSMRSCAACARYPPAAAADNKIVIVTAGSTRS